jgi:hypothetical protein
MVPQRYAAHMATSDRLEFSPVMAHGQQVHVYDAESYLVATVWYSGESWSVAVRNRPIAHGIPTEDEAREVVRMWIDWHGSSNSHAAGSNDGQQ